MIQLSNICSCSKQHQQKYHYKDHDNLGRTASQTFISNRMVDRKIQLNNFLHLKNILATVQTKIKGQLLSIKKQGELLSRLVAAAKNRPEFNVKDCIGNYECNTTI